MEPQRIYHEVNLARHSCLRKVLYFQQEAADNAEARRLQCLSNKTPELSLNTKSQSQILSKNPKACKISAEWTDESHLIPRWCF